MNENHDHALESLLNQYRPATPDTRLRAQILRQAHQSSRWAFAEGLAALLLVGLTLAQIAGTVTRILPTAPVDPARTQQLALAIAKLDLPLDNEQTQLMARQLVAGEHLVRLPQVYATAMNAINPGVLP